MKKHREEAVNPRATVKQILLSVVTNCVERINKMKENLEAGEFAAALGMP